MATQAENSSPDSVVKPRRQPVMGSGGVGRTTHFRSEGHKGHEASVGPLIEVSRMRVTRAFLNDINLPTMIAPVSRGVELRPPSTIKFGTFRARGKQLLPNRRGLGHPSMDHRTIIRPLLERVREGLRCGHRG